MTKTSGNDDFRLPRGCPLDKVLRLLAGDWTSHILWVLSRNGPTRHGELRRLVEGISSKVLTDRLRMLETEGIVFREYEPTIPPKVTYGLTERGQKLDTALKSIEGVARLF
ncbi:helix-turn-helix domain-containing protein [Thalassococcus sp. S3]|uniref:winged helix-turn-helix transcriptional regulator n=1 Tax=Thalassococcus sp. S3 TaxID=2017482 RepID=UPI0010243235|nr:helix-turn-helix domain-containing protein [Thalassococcus sp. S3]QBF31013.1 transcriptional regulator [Thalassococcus sp. S3]